MSAVAHDLVVIGASWGGLHALEVVLGALPGGFGAAVVVAQHRAARSGELLADLLRSRCALPVAEACDRDPLVPGRVLVAPADYHLLVDGTEVSLSVDEPVRFSRPSIDVLLASAAHARRERLIGVVLTGSNEDGAAGLAEVHARGGLALVQDPAGAERAEMPLAARRAVPAARVLALETIGPQLCRLTGAPA